MQGTKDEDATEGSSGTSKDLPFDVANEETKGDRSGSDEDVGSKAPYERRISKLEDVNKFQNELDRVTKYAKEKQAQDPKD